MIAQTDITQLIETLRTELEAYGTLFRLLEDQRSALINQNADEIIEVSTSIDHQAAELNRLRQNREDQVTHSPFWIEEEPRTLGRFISQLKHESKPLLEELFAEVNRLIRESKRQLEKNQMLYRRAWDIGQDMMRAINPQNDFSETYRRDGYSRQPSIPQRTQYVKLA